MSYWEFIGLIDWAEAWEVLSAILAAVAITGVFLFCVFVAPGLRWYWNAILIPALLVALFFVVTWLAWSGTQAMS